MCSQMSFRLIEHPSTEKLFWEIEIFFVKKKKEEKKSYEKLQVNVNII